MVYALLDLFITMKNKRNKTGKALCITMFIRIVITAAIFHSNTTFSSELVGHSSKQNDTKNILFLSTQTANIRIPIQSWKTLRDKRIVKQDLDFSCSAASLATLINEFYGQSVTEEDLLKVMDKGELRASFEDMQKALPHFGFKAQGFAASYEQLMKLKAPVVVYLQHRKDDHFSVLRGINEDTVWLADPSLGNRTYSKEQFLEMWQTRSDKTNAELAGKFLAVLPNKNGITASKDFFTKTPHRQSTQATQQLNFRNM